MIIQDPAWSLGGIKLHCLSLALQLLQADTQPLVHVLPELRMWTPERRLPNAFAFLTRMTQFRVLPVYDGGYPNPWLSLKLDFCPLLPCLGKLSPKAFLLGDFSPLR